MDEDKFQYATITLIIILLVAVLYLSSHVKALTNTLQSTDCAPLIDAIYEHCMEEGSTTIQTMKGLKTVLTDNNGTCVIKTK